MTKPSITLKTVHPTLNPAISHYKLNENGKKVFPLHIPSNIYFESMLPVSPYPQCSKPGREYSG